jgi:hypothetical protein
VGLGHVILHEPRVVVKHIVAEDLKKELSQHLALLDDESFKH